MTRALLILVLLALVVVIGLSFVGGEPVDVRKEAVNPADQPGYFLTHATITDTDKDGSARFRIRAERIEQKPSDNSIELANLNFTYSSTGDRDWVVTADHGVVPDTSRIVHLDGDVRVRGMATGDGAETVIETDALDFDTEKSIAQTDGDVRIGMGSRALTARGLNADLKQGLLRLKSRVHGQFNAPFNR